MTREKQAGQRQAQASGRRLCHCSRRRHGWRCPENVELRSGRSSALRNRHRSKTRASPPLKDCSVGQLVGAVLPLLSRANTSARQPTFLSIIDHSLRHAYVGWAAEYRGTKISVFGGPVFHKDDREFREVLIPREFRKVIVFVDAGELKAKGFLLTQNLDELEALELDEFKVFQIALTESNRAAA